MVLKIEKQIYDNVHGYIGLTETEIGIIDTEIFQRLRQIRQLGPAELVYPGATHTRFAHSIGTLFTMDQFLKNAVRSRTFDEDELQRFRLAALLHDVGHYPYSHITEYVAVKKFNGKDHVSLGIEFINNFLKEKLENYSVKDITGLISGKSKAEFGLLLSSALDADKSDYLLRDSYNTGVPYGRVSISTILRFLTFEKDMIIFEKADAPIESFLIGRYEMYRTVYHHKTVAAFNLMVQKIFERLVKEGYLPDPRILQGNKDIIDICRYDDSALLQAMYAYLEKGKDRYLLELIGMLVKRMPLELAYANTLPLSKKKGGEESDTIRELEEDKGMLSRLAGDVGLDPDWIFPVTLRELSLIDEDTPILIRKKGDLVPLWEADALILRMIGSKTLYDERIYTKSGYGRKLGSAFNKLKK